MVETQETKEREQRILGDSWQCETIGYCSKGDSCSFRHDISKRAQQVPEAKVPVEEWFDCPARITSKELAPIHSVKNGTLQNACSTSPRVVVGLGKSALMRIARFEEQLSKRSQKNSDKSAVDMPKST